MSSIKLYQISKSLDIKNNKFQAFDQVDGKIDESIYKKVFDGNVGTNNLETIYYIFNTNLPKDFTGHSLSISDIIEICDSHKSFFYYCDVIGFEKIDFNSNNINVAQDIKVVISEYGCNPYEKYVLNDEKAFSLELDGSASERMELQDGICFYRSENKDKLMFVGVNEESQGCSSLSISQAQRLKEQFNYTKQFEMEQRPTQINTQMY